MGHISGGRGGDTCNLPRVKRLYLYYLALGLNVDKSHLWSKGGANWK